MMKKHSVIINFALFQLAWFAVFFLQSDALLLVGIAIALMFFLSPHKSRDTKFVLIGLWVGLSIELVAVNFSVIDYGDETLPVWLVLLWLALLFSFRESLSKLFYLPIKYRAPIVWLCTPGSYYAGSKVGVLSTLEPLWLFWFIYGAIWLIGFEMLRWLDSCSFVRRNDEVMS
ncbi:MULTISPECIES: DUF2878 domain-containing protein [Pseudoalteromonas]|uniref:DUF2878 domain-containing protein n=1 Tax=Pseudoalteromonas luteoviolacea (strain 2ta16) TaxID=1353533 RepID=V4HUC7_PSEL2|nr:MULTISPECIES: DUF2878 domain-containing protein [Pseudoalteromonas]ESP94410.1 protein of unknown function (DUF2878) [Pseudoalteromonas luteoviolacea 2ta16]KZN32103.1 hypothetical protein N483_02890 [Pseudoalteromonas luteoviolacea NCIMB 1944]MCG7547906.1 DUF2878 domain-containing protein [Pseudoalteromonas sp. Of7M-16]